MNELTEKLSLNDIQQALVELLTASNYRNVQVALKHPQQRPLALKVNLSEEERHCYRDQIGIIELFRGASDEVLRLSIKPASGLKTTYVLAQSLSKLFTTELGITPTVKLLDKKLFGLFDDRNGRIRLEFSDLEGLQSALNKHPHPAIQKIITEVRQKRLLAEIQKASEFAEQERIKSEERARRVAQEQYMSRRKERPFTDRSRPLILDALCVVHATDYIPRMLPDGTAEIDTLSTALNGQQFRNTLHFALNHKVMSHPYGSWDDKKFTIIGDLKETIEANGLPRRLNTVDTWWTRGWQEPLKIPNALLVQPAEIDALRRVSLTEALYKAHDFTLEQAVELAPHTLEASNLFGKKEGFADALQKLSQQEPCAELKEAVETNFHLSKDQCKKCELLVASENNRATSDAAIDNLGYVICGGGSWAWDGSWDVTASTSLLANSLGTRCGAHTDSEEGRLEETLRNVLNEHKKGNLVPEHLDELLRLLFFAPFIEEKTKEVAQKVLEKNGLGDILKAYDNEPHPDRPNQLLGGANSPLTKKL